MVTRMRNPSILAALVVLAACGDSDPLRPDAESEALDDAVALVAADAALEDLAVMIDMVPLGGPAGTGPMGDRRGLVRERTVTFLNADGGTMDGYDSELTAAIHTTLTVQGEIVRDAFTATVERFRDMTVSGLEGAETTRIFDGTGEELHASTRVTDRHGTRSYRFEASAVIDAVVRPVGPTDAPWPLSGTITRHVRVTRMSSTDDQVITRERTVVITFDGTRHPTMTVDGVEYEVDLGAGDGDHPARRRGR